MWPNGADFDPATLHDWPSVREELLVARQAGTPQIKGGLTGEWSRRAAESRRLAAHRERGPNQQEPNQDVGHIPADVVEATWPRIGALEPAAMAALQKRNGPFQPELTGFVLGFTSDLRPDALGVTLYAMVVVYEMFRVHHIKVRKARDRIVIRQWETARDLTEELREAGVTRDDLLGSDIETTEPFALRYVIEAFTEQTEDDPIDISDDEFWHMFAVLKTVVETLHEMAGAERLERPGR